MNKYILLIIILSGCGQAPPDATVDPALKPYFKSFETNIGVSTDGITGRFADTENQPNPLGETVAECLVYDDGTRIIQVDPNFWKSASEDQRTQTLEHELGHCAMGLKHVNTLQSDGCPTSIMFPYAFGDPCFSRDEAYYIQELISHK